MDDKELDYKLEIENELADKNQWPKSFKISLGIAIGIIVILIIVLIIIIIHYEDESSDESSNESNHNSQPEPQPQLSFDYSFFGEKYYNHTYDVNGKIENSFKEGGENYIKDIGNINNGEDYDKNERNIYDIYIPQYALDRKDKINGIMLWIHGGGWLKGNLEDMDEFCKLFSQQGYISATVGYTLLIDYYKIFNIFKILDEITACIKAIKKELIEKGFDGDKLRLGIGGYSAGGHLALLYSYLIKDIEIIPLKFVIDFVGPIGLHEKYFYMLNPDKLNSPNDTLINIEDISTIEQAKKYGKIVKIFPESQVLMYMNAFYGNKYSKEELDLMLDENGHIIYENEKYKRMYEVVKYGYVTEIEDKHKLPTICIYGGFDFILGVSTYAYLKEKAVKDGRPLDFIYSRYEGHGLVFPSKEDGKIKVWEMSSLIMKYFEKYFTS